MKPIPGFDYVTGRPVTRSRAEWRALLAATMAAGGSKRVEHGETYIHGPARGRPLIAEVYATLPAPR